jgi:hypothetical protein
MKECVSNSYVEKALGELIDVLGVKEEPNYANIEALFHEKDIGPGVKSIALQLGLPIDINLEYGEKNIQSEGLARTDANGRGIEGIVAQVRIPAYLPWFGTSEMINYPIKIFLGSDYRNHIWALMTILVHELSHVLLHSLRSQHSDNEIYTDLAGPILGLTTVVEFGRKTETTEYTDEGTRTKTTTYGYLSDKQFDSVKKLIAQALHDRRGAGIKAETEISELNRLCMTAKQQIAKFKKNLGSIDNYPKNRISEEDAVRLVSFHHSNYLDDFMIILQECEKHLEQASSFIKLNRHYTKKSAVEYDNIRKRTELTAAKVLSKTASLNADIELIKGSMKLRGKLLS